MFTFLRDKSRAKSSCTLDELEKLESFLADESSFRGKEQFRQALGTLFNGIDSKWDEIGGLITWAENLSVASGSSGLARRLASLPPGITDNWPEENEMQNTLEEMYQEVEKLNQALPLSGRARLISEITETPLEKLFLFLDELENLISDIEELLTPFVLDSNCLLLEISEAIASLKQANELRFVLENDNDFRSLLGDYFKGINTDIVIITKTFDWALELKKLNLPFGSFNSSSTENGTVLIDNLREHIKDWNHDLETIIADLESLNQYGNVEFHTLLGGEVSQITLSSMHKRIEQLLENINHLREWADYSRYVETGNQKGLNHIIELLERGGLVPDEVGDTYLLAVYENLVKKIIRKYPLLSNFSRSQHEESRKTFVELDKKILKLSQEQIGYNASQVMLPHGSSRGPVRNLTEMALLNHEFRKSKGHIPIRRLLERAGNAVRALKPAFMMSPLSVAQFLAPGMHEFDVVIMDEASQIQPHEAFGAIARGKQMVIVGDPKQLPPTTFFDVIFHDPEDDPDKTIIEDTNSILEACMSIYHPPRRLIWHYRSEHESLIAFSNFHWYNNELIIFPSPDNTHADLGVYYKYVEGATYASGKNEVEADHVARTIVEHAKRNPNLSLGIGTFNLEQRDLIEDRLEKLRKENIANDFAIERLMEAHDGNEPLFIKNLENLQGDERDVIFISCTYGPDKAIGTVYQRFGPVNSKNGPRRLNVLFTRAKKRMVVFTSMKPEDIKIGPGSSEGAIALREFLAYAQTGQLPDYGKPTGREPDSDFEIAVAQVLQKNGYNIVPQIGVAGYFIDIGVSHPDRKGEYILGIECDGMNYHSSSFARDRDRLREESIIKRGWRVHRIWSTDWFKNRDFEVERLIRTLEKHRETDKNVVRVVEEPIEPPILPTMDWSRSTHLSDRELRTRLVSWGKQNIAETDAYGNNGVLRSDLLDALVAERPKSWEDFRECIPLKLREKVDPRQSHYLEDIFAIIEESL